MLYLNLGPIFVARGIERPSTYLVNAGFSAHSTHFLLHGKSRSLRLDHIEKLCKLLICEPSDLFIWYAAKNETFPDTHPIHKLRKKRKKASATSLPIFLSNSSWKSLRPLKRKRKKCLATKQKRRLKPPFLFC